MAKITRAQLEKRRRIELYKKIIIYGFLVMTMLPIFTSVFLFYKVDQLEQKLEYALSEDGGDYLTLRSSREAFLNNPHADSEVFADSIKSVLGNASVDTNNVVNTEDEQGSKDTETEQVDDNEKNTEKAGKTSKKTGKRVYLTFDDGPSIYTGQILDILSANDVKATFFVIEIGRAHV